MALIGDSGYAAGQDVLAFTNQNGITGTWNPSTGVMALTGTATKADYQTALHQEQSLGEEMRGLKAMVLRGNGDGSFQPPDPQDAGGFGAGPIASAMFAGATPVPVADAARAYVESIEGSATGQVFRVGY